MRGFHNIVILMATLLVLNVVLSGSARAQNFETIYNFTGRHDGATPLAGLTIDGAGNLYGTTAHGGDHGSGTVFKLSHKRSGWILSSLHSFAGGEDGASPAARVVFGPNGSLYGTTNAKGKAGCFHGLGCGTVFNLRPPPRACTTALCPWTETVLYRFTGRSDGGNPSSADLIFDQLGNLYGTTAYGGRLGCGGYGCGVVYSLEPRGGGGTENVLYSFTGGNDGGNPGGGVIFDQAGNLYGVTTQFGPSDQGTVYQLTPSESGWTQHLLYDFQGEYGTAAVGSLVFDSYGNLFGATRLDNINYPWYPGTLFEIEDSNNNWTLAYHYDFGDQYPQTGLTMDAAGTLYCASMGIGELGIYGSIYKLTPSNGTWNFATLYTFSDGSTPNGGVVLDASGHLYGTTSNGGAYGYGTAWEITQ